MEYAIIGLVCFIVGVGFSLLLKVKIDVTKAYDNGYDHGFSDASMAVEFLNKRVEGK